ncbi:MAG: hypothetical protein WA139_02285 [Candidatus Aenigmatarchaeota archaeon]
MPMRKLFWLLSAAIIALFIIQTLGYFSATEIIIALLLLDVAVVEFSRQEDKHAVETQLKPELIARVGNVEKLCTNMLSSINALPTVEHFYQIAEQKIGEHGASLREEIKDDLDRLAKKAVDIENRLFEMRKTVASGIGGIDDRLRSLETGKWTIESEDEEDKEEVAIGEENFESPSPALEEVVYGEGAAIME